MNRFISFLTLTATGLIPRAGAADDWKLQPLEYNNPGLVVDLGVGLWAWPLPMDYDGDGDHEDEHEEHLCALGHRGCHHLHPRGRLAHLEDSKHPN